ASSSASAAAAVASARNDVLRMVRTGFMLRRNLGQSSFDRPLRVFVRIIRALGIGTTEPVRTPIEQREVELLHLLHVTVGIQRREEGGRHHAVAAVIKPSVWQAHQNVK